MQIYEFRKTRLPWRNTYVPPRFFIFDYRALFIIIPFIFYIRLWTIGLLILLLLTFYVLQLRHIEPDNIMRWIRTSLAGPERTQHGRARLRQSIDYGFETHKMIRSEQRRIQAIKEARKSPKYKGVRFPDSLGESRKIELKKRFKAAKFG